MGRILAFLSDTGARKWGRPYLTRRFFSLLGERLGERVVLMLALRDNTPIAGALNLLGGETLYGRYWGAREDIPFLHFELCYYQAIDVAIAAWAQAGRGRCAGANISSARGYLPTSTFSAHYIPDPNFRRAVADYLDHERRMIAANIEALEEEGPYRK